LEAVVVTIPFPDAVRSITELKASRGEASFNARKKVVEWKVPTKDGASVTGTATLAGAVLGPVHADDEVADGDGVDRAKVHSLEGYYDEDSAAVAQHHTDPNGITANDASGAKRKQANRALMPRSAAVSFTVRGWLPSGIRVESLIVDASKSRGLGEGVKPFKGVKYITVSKQGIERRAS
jgi:hypothetical protein